MLRVWRDEPGFLTYHCARCGVKGYAHTNDDACPIDLRRQLNAQSERSDVEYHRRQREKARWLWRQSVPLGSTIAEHYLRGCRRIALEHWRSTLRYLPPTKPDHHPATIAAFGMPGELEPGVLSIEEAAVRAVHLTILKPDGSGKVAGRNKIMIGRSLGVPIVLAPFNDMLGLAITEGIEEGLTVYLATGLGVWVAGSASRMPALADAVPDYANCITIIQDNNEAGRRGARGLAERLRARGLYAEIVSSSLREQQGPSAA